MGRDVITLRECQMRFKKILSGNFHIEGLPRSGSPKAFESDDVEVVVEADPRLTMRELAQRPNIPRA